MEVVVPDDQLSLAIGKKGQNVRLASRLTGWNLEVRSEAEAEEEARLARLALASIPGISEVTAEFLFQHGFKSVQEVAESDESGLAQVEGIESDRIPVILEVGRKHAAELKRLEEEAAAAAEAAALEPVAEEPAGGGAAVLDEPLLPVSDDVRAGDIAIETGESAPVVAHAGTGSDGEGKSDAS